MFLCTMTRNSECDRFMQAEDNVMHYCWGNETTAKFYKTWQNQERLITVITAHWVRFIQRCVKLSCYRMFEYFNWACLTEQVHFRTNNNVINYSGQISPKQTLRIRMSVCLRHTKTCTHRQARRVDSPAPMILSMEMNETSISWANSCTAWLGSS